MFEHFYDTHISNVANSAQQVGKGIADIMNSAEKENTVLLIAETHYEISQSLFQIALFKEMRRYFSFANSFELVSDDFVPMEKIKPQIWDSSFATAMKFIHPHCYYPMSSCLAPTYVLSKINKTIHCNDVSMNDDEAMTPAAMRSRNRSIANSLQQQQKDTGNLVCHVGGHDHVLTDKCQTPTLQELLMETKQVILLNLIEETDLDEQRKQHRQSYDTLEDRKKAKLIAQIDVCLPAMQVFNDRKVFNQWDKIVLSNNVPELLLSDKNRKQHRRLNEA